MTDASDDGFNDALEQARRQFVSAAHGTLESFELLGTQLASRPDSAEILTPLRRELHRLNGSAGTFGFARLGRMAAALESVVKKWAADPQLDRDRRGPIIARRSCARRSARVAPRHACPPSASCSWTCAMPSPRP